MRKREKLGSPEEESAASTSTESAAGLGAGTPEGVPARGRDMEREQRGTDPEHRRGDDDAADEDSEPPKI